MTQAKTRHRGRHRGRVLLAPAVATVLMMAAAPAGASSLTGRVGTTHSARAVFVTNHAHVTRHPLLRFHALGRKVG